MELSKKDTKMIQGLSVLAMVWLHLFCRDYRNLFYPLFFIKGIPLSFYIAQLSDFCVMGFAFCSGYAHMSQFSERGYYRRRLRALIKLLINYWIVLIMFTLVSVVSGNSAYMPGSILTFLRNILLDVSYNGAWWYMYAYVFIVIISPLLLRSVEKYRVVYVLFAGFFIYCVSYYIRFRIVDAGWLLSKVGPIGMTVFEYLIGAVCYRKKIFTVVGIFWNKCLTFVKILISILCVLSIFLGRTLVISSLFVAPVTGGIIIFLFHFWNKPKWVENLFFFIGRHSTNIWLTHMFFYAVVFKNFVYIAKIPILIFAFMLVITITVSTIIQGIQKPIMKQINYHIEGVL